MIISDKALAYTNHDFWSIDRKVRKNNYIRNRTRKALKKYRNRLKRNSEKKTIKYHLDNAT